MEKKIYDEITIVAYDLYEKSGRAHGQDVQNWLEAERIVLARHEKGTKKKKTIGSSKTATKKTK